MGAHSLGSAVQWNSGYKGKWTGPTLIGFNERFYTNMLSSSIKVDQYGKSLLKFGRV